MFSRPGVSLFVFPLASSFLSPSSLQGFSELCRRVLTSLPTRIAEKVTHAEILGLLNCFSSFLPLFFFFLTWPRLFDVTFPVLVRVNSGLTNRFSLLESTKLFQPRSLFSFPKQMLSPGRLPLALSAERDLFKFLFGFGLYSLGFL